MNRQGQSETGNFLNTVHQAHWDKIQPESKNQAQKQTDRKDGDACGNDRSTKQRQTDKISKLADTSVQGGNYAS